MFPTLLADLTDKLDKNETLQQEVNLKPTAYVQKLNLLQGGKILHGKCPCVRDKFHAWVAILN